MAHTLDSAPDRSPRLSRADGVAYFAGIALPPGPWHTEPDHVDDRSPAGLPIVLHRNGLGGWCGYVGVQPGHPWHGKEYDDVPADVHGGLTYSARCAGDICHVPTPGESDDVWWIGFDCVHAGDLSLYDVSAGLRSPFGGVYRTVEYARAAALGLAEQAAAVTPAPAAPAGFALTPEQYHRFAALFDAALVVESTAPLSESPYVLLHGPVAAAALRMWAAAAGTYPVAVRELEHEGRRWTALCVSRDEYSTFISVHVVAST